MVKIEETEDVPSHNPPTLSLSPTPSPPPPQSPPSASPPHTPGTPSSISSAHTLSPTPSPPNQLLHQHPLSLPALPPPALANRLVVEQAPAVVTKNESEAPTGIAHEGGGREGGGWRRRRRRREKMVRSGMREKVVKRVDLGLRVCEFAVCLVAFSVMASDKNRGWALDSFDRYKEFRYALSVSVIGFAYATLQGYEVARQLFTGNYIVCHRLWYHVSFAMDQVLAYLLLSASSSAATRIDDWISNWGQDKFPTMASASVGMSFLSFVAFALSSLISGYLLCLHRS